MSLTDLMEKYGKPIVSSNRGGMIRAMFYDANANDVRIYVRDRSGVIFVIDPPVFLAVDAFKNPHFYADAAFNGNYNPRRVSPVSIVGKAA